MRSTVAVAVWEGRSATIWRRRGSADRFSPMPAIVRANDLNRQILMTHDWIGKPRVECAAKRLRELNPRLKVQAVNANLSEQNAAAHRAEAAVSNSGPGLGHGRRDCGGGRNQVADRHRPDVARGTVVLRCWRHGVPTD